MKKFNQFFVIGLALAMLTPTFISCNDSKAKNEPSPDKVTEAVTAEMTIEGNQTTKSEIEQPTFILKYKGQDWEVNKAEWEAWKTDNATYYKEATQEVHDNFETNFPRGQEAFHGAAVADGINGYIDMEMISANRMPMQAVFFIQLKSMYLNGGEKAFE